MKTFKYKQSWHELLKLLSKEERGIILCAITDYAIEGKVAKIKPNALNVLFLKIRHEIDVSVSRSLTGSKGGFAKSKSFDMSGKRNDMSGKSYEKENKEENPPTPPKEEKKEKKENISIDIQKKKFLEQVMVYSDTYPQEMLQRFFEYWTETNKSGTKMKFQLERTWDLSLRLKRWERNGKNIYPTNYSIGINLQNNPKRYDNLEEEKLAW